MPAHGTRFRLATTDAQDQYLADYEQDGRLDVAVDRLLDVLLAAGGATCSGAGDPDDE